MARWLAAFGAGGLLVWCCALADCAPNGCSAFDTADECAASSSRCNGSARRQACQATACSATWSDDEACPAAKPFCVQTSPVSSALGGTAECAAEPSCSATRGCASSGLCGDRPDGSCVVTAEGCANACQNAGYCGFDGSACVATPDGCAASNQCATNGVCAEAGGRCQSSAEGCAAATDTCTGSGLCGFANGQCAPTQAGCQAARDCATSGQCEVGAERCAVSDAGCAASTACTMFGQCHAKDGLCSP